MTREEIKVRQMTNQYLLTQSDKLTVVRDLCGLQSQFLVNALHALKIRCNDFDETTVADGLVKNWTVRGTVHVFAESDLTLFVRCDDGKNYLRNEWEGYRFWNNRDCWALSPERQAFLSEVVLHALSDGAKTREELKVICRENGMTYPEETCMFEPWGGGVRELCGRGFMNYVVQEKKAFCLAPPYTPMRDETAQLEIARRYFANYGPATVHDAMYFLGATQTAVKAWMAKLPLESVSCEGKTYYWIPGGKTYGGEIPDCLFLAGFDQLMLGYQKKESLYLAPEHLRGIFNLAGIVMPAVLLRGNAVGKWKKKGRKLVLTPFVSLSKRDRDTIAEKAQSLWELGEILFEEQ